MTDSGLIAAATVVLLRDHEARLQVLMLERPDRGSFAGAWVFPGGRVDEADAHGLVPGDEEAAAKVAAIRETREETSLELDSDSLAAVARWTPPLLAPARFRTWFYYAAAPEGEVVLSPEESVAHEWMSPADALARHGSGRMVLAVPTWVTLHRLLAFDTTEAAMSAARSSAPAFLDTHLMEGVPAALWQRDVAYDHPHLFDADGPRHRLTMAALPWVFEHE